MVKKYLFLFILIVGFSVQAQGSQQGNEIDLAVGIIDPTNPNGESPRGPVLPPSVSIDGHTLYTQYVPFDATLQILDSSGAVVYSAFVPAFTHSVILPASLTGDYVIQLIEGYWYFYGWVHL